jgi:TolB-like protein/DNA-binding SARP family transcriptional activator/Flp pilus assembly protein TadD
MMQAAAERSAMAGLTLTLLGGFEARLTDGAAVDLPGQKDRALLAFLAIASGAAQSRERLAGLLWSERGDHQARDSLKQALMRLRRGLGATEGGVLRADRQSVALDHTAVSVDVQTFEQLLRDGSVGSLAQATALYRGDLLDGVAVRDPAFEDWLLVERQRLRQLFERALASLMEKALASGDPDTAAAAARRLLLLDPLSEAAYRTLMQVHCDQAQTSQAVKLYDGLRDRLHRELGVQPESATVALYERIRRRPASAGPADPAEATGKPGPEQIAPPAAKPSIAVLPFVNVGGDPEQRYFSDGITEDIITELSRFRTLLVIARNSSFRYRGGDLDVTRIGRELDVRYLVEGSVRRLGDRLRISAQLIDAATGNHLWADHYDCDAVDVLTVQDDIVRAIATTLGDRIEAAGRERVLRLSPDALSAYDHVLRSEAHLMRFAKNENIEARRLAQRAIELDPQSADALAQVGWTHCMDHLFGWVEERTPTLATALALAQRAVLLDAAHCRARSLLGFVHTFRREYDEARAQLRSAIALNPNDVEARGIYGVYLIAAGETDAALEQFGIAKRNNPFETEWVTVCRGIALFTARRYDEAIATLTEVHNRTNEGRCWLAASYAAAGRLAEAGAMLAEFLAVAERDMARFPGRRLEDWKPYLHHLVEYRDPQEFEHLFAALRTAGLQ